MKEPTSTDAGKIPKVKNLDRATALGISDPEREPDGGGRNKSRDPETSHLVSSVSEGQGGTLPDAVAQIDGSGPLSGDPPLFQITSVPTAKMERSPGAVQHSTIAERRRTAPPRFMTPQDSTPSKKRDSLTPLTSQDASEDPMTP